MALGAQPRAILKLVVGRGLVLVSAGVVIGVLASFGLTRFIENMLFGVTPTDPITFTAIVTSKAVRISHKKAQDCAFCGPILQSQINRRIIINSRITTSTRSTQHQIGAF